MPIYRKTPLLTYERLMESDLLNGAPQSFLGLEINTDGTSFPYCLYVVKGDGNDKRLIRFRLRKMSGEFFPMREYFVYDPFRSAFSISPQPHNGVPPRISERCVFTNAEIQYLVDILKLKERCDSVGMEADALDLEPGYAAEPLQHEVTDAQNRCEDEDLVEINQPIYWCLMSIIVPQNGVVPAIPLVLSRNEYATNDFRLTLLKFINEWLESEEERRNFEFFSYLGAYKLLFTELLETPGLSYTEHLKALQGHLIQILPPESVRSLYELKVSAFLCQHKIKLNDLMDDAIRSHASPWALLDALKRLNQNNRLTNASCKAVLLSPSPLQTIRCLMDHPIPKKLVKDLLILNHFGLLRREHYERVCQSTKLDDLAFKIVCDDSHLVNPFVAVRTTTISPPQDLSLSLSVVNPQNVGAGVTLEQSSKAPNNDFSYHPDCRQIKTALDRLLASTTTMFANEPALINKVRDFCNAFDLKLQAYTRNPRAYPLFTKEASVRLAITQAESCFGINHKVVRLFADLLMTASCLVGIGFFAIGLKKATTGRCFFYLGKREEKEIVKTFGADCLL